MELGREKLTVDLRGRGVWAGGSRRTPVFISLGVKCVNLFTKGPHKDSKTNLYVCV